MKFLQPVVNDTQCSGRRHALQQPTFGLLQGVNEDISNKTIIA